MDTDDDLSTSEDDTLTNTKFGPETLTRQKTEQDKLVEGL